MADESSKKLSRMDLLNMAVGNIIGVGIMTMTGIAIGFTGRSVNIAFIVAGLITILSAIPQIYIGGTANFLGGQYSQIGILSGKKLAGIYTFINLSMTFALSMYALSFAEYFLSIIPRVNEKLLCLVVLTALVLMHLVGVKQAARLQNAMCAILAIALAAYIAFGVGHIQPGYFEMPGFLSGGIPGFLMASVYLSFAAGGATYVVNYSSEAKNPTKDIPFAIILSTVGIVVIYAVMATVAAGVLPLDQVAGKALSVSAKSFMPGALYTFFVVGGAIFALLTTLNFSIGSLVYPVLRACEDGWLPKGLTARNKKFGTTHWILLGIWLVAVVPILCGVDLSTVANSTVLLTTGIRILIAYCAIRLPKVMPELWNKSPYHVKSVVLKTVSIASIAVSVLSLVVLIATSTQTQLIGNAAILAVAFILALWRGRKAKLSASYTER